MGVARVVSVNVGLPRVTEWFGRKVLSGIWKEPVRGRVAVRDANLDGDGQADPRVHGGRDKAVYAYAAEDYAWWSEQLGRAITPATFGENLTTEAIDLGAVTLGTRMTIGTSVLEVAGPRLPCFKLGMRMGDAAFVDAFTDAARFGAYLRIVGEGDVGEGDEIRVEPPDVDDLTIRELGLGYESPSPELVERVLAHPAAGDSWHEWAARRRARGKGA
jgi:MOSC domain-containing protein YiiM